MYFWFHTNRMPKSQEKKSDNVQKNWQHFQVIVSNGGLDCWLFRLLDENVGLGSRAKISGVEPCRAYCHSRAPFFVTNV